jgi:hypothetical protein
MILTVKQGNHYSNGWSLKGFHTGRSYMEYLVTFDHNCAIVPEDMTCRNDWNKLFGWSYGDHHSNSLRLAWRSRLNMIQIGAYMYEKGIRRSRPIAYISVDTPVKMSIYHDQKINTIRFICGDMFYDTFWQGDPASWGYNLSLYYGGNCPAPATMTVKLDTL